jgi:predicted Zn-dependent protease
MKFTPKALEGNVNVSRTHPLAELAWLAGGLLTLVAAVYLILWLVTDLLLPQVPVGVEVWAGKHLLHQVAASRNPPLQQRLDALLAALPADSPLQRYDFSVSVVKNEEVNAMALPGGHIVVFSGLLQQVRSENELGMVLAHELGHYARRDHLRGMGRGLGATLVLATLFGRDSSAARIASRLFTGVEMRYSQAQEAAADAFGLHLLAARYGHAGGATDFFSRLAGQGNSRFSYLLASHPRPEARIASLQQMISAAGYRLAATEPLQGDSLLAGREGQDQFIH